MNRKSFLSIFIVFGIAAVVSGYRLSTAKATLLDFEPTRAESSEKWTSKAPMPTPRENFAIAEVDGKIYCIGGTGGGARYSDIVEVYDPATDSWTQREVMPYSCYGCAAGVVNGRIYVIGGQRTDSPAGTMNKVQEYNPATDTWTIKTLMPTPRYDFAIGVVNNKIYAIGGYQWGLGGQLDTVEEYNPATDSWTTKTSMPTGRKNLAAAVFDNKIYAIGGGSGSIVKSLDVNEVYDPSTDSWSTKAPMLTPRYGLAVSVADQRIYAIGGYWAEPGRQYQNVNEEYDPVNDTWIKRLPMPTTRVHLSAITVNEKIYAIGGGSADGANEQYTTPHAEPAPQLSVTTLKNHITIVSNITIFYENKSAMETVTNVSSHLWTLPLGTYYVQASTFYHNESYTSNQIHVILIGYTELTINFSFSNLTVLCTDIENRQLENCTVVFTRNDEQHIQTTSSSGSTFLEAYYGNWTIKVYWMDVLEGEINVSINEPETHLMKRCNVGDVIVTVIDHEGHSAEADVTLRNETYKLTFSGRIVESMKNITFTQIPLINYNLTVQNGFGPQTQPVDTEQTRQIRIELEPVVPQAIFIVLGVIAGLIIGSLVTWTVKERRKENINNNYSSN